MRYFIVFYVEENDDNLLLFNNKVFKFEQFPKRTELIQQLRDNFNCYKLREIIGIQEVSHTDATMWDLYFEYINK